jgi:hypothetical protein
MASGSASAWASSTARAIERLDLRSSGVGSTLAEPDAVTVPGAGACAPAEAVGSATALTARAARTSGVRRDMRGSLRWVQPLYDGRRAL